MKLAQSQAGRPYDDRLRIGKLELHWRTDHNETDVSSIRLALVEQLPGARTSVVRFRPKGHNRRAYMVTGEDNPSGRLCQILPVKR